MEKATSWNKPMNFIEILLSEKLKDRNSMLDIFGSDRKMLQIACQDLTNYLKVHWSLIGKETNECDLVDKLERFFNENPMELEEFINLWTGIWLKKWKQRVKLLIGSEKPHRWNKVTRVLNGAEPLWRRLPNRWEMQEIIVSTLVKNGEICGTSILAENLLKMELGKNKKTFKKKEELILNVVNTTLRKARDLAQSQGPLIFVKIDKGYYNVI